ncbi:RsmB/NOP family class I SAM-dependent RNA methyltransferase [Sphingomonas quercus]|uniref:RsmB/NOP family class I SAM-dependent RNA methyltransferase n=1 Tax=Sphingomonas quercus TaxID=2842451 RepID=A0ABS6BFN0_9SPHN|nr:RsmB/NOP family class I SAM-dependent RNA methyltransferase [Sphingomonas quercus]MBU3077101.1 RsmB/NOP family class I SAM-dependent RNA methyltransferase [Sphingomonas quercus]
MSTPDKPEPAGTETRRAAMRLIDAVLRRGLPLEATFDVATQHLTLAVDRAHAQAIAAETLRRLPDLDALIDAHTEKPIPADAKARTALRLALVQALALGTPPHAAIATVLPLVDGGPRRLVHGVFGAVMAAEAKLPDPPSLPAAVTKRWRKRYGGPAVRAAQAAIAAPPPLDLTLRDPATTGDWAARLGAESLMPGHLRLPRASVTELAGYDDGAWWVQDLAAAIPARLLGAGPGTALDLCAAPGGKALQLAAAGWQVTALDISAARLGRLRDNLTRTGLAAAIVEADVMTWAPPAPVDVILLDAPCSATGIFRRHPDVLHRTSPRAIANLAEQQAAMLARAARWLKPGGRIVYAVCSAEPSEGEAVADAFLAQHADFAADPVTAGELPALIPPVAGRLRVAPGAIVEHGGADAFFATRFQRLG